MLLGSPCRRGPRRVQWACRAAWCCFTGSHRNRPAPGSEISRSRALVRAGAGSVAPAVAEGRWDISSTRRRSAARLVARRCSWHRDTARLRASPAGEPPMVALQERRGASGSALPKWRAEVQDSAVLLLGARIKSDLPGVSPSAPARRGDHAGGGGHRAAESRWGNAGPTRAARRERRGGESACSVATGGVASEASAAPGGQG